MLQLKDIYYSIGEAELLKGITWMVNPGKKLILTGPNGSGKTTLLRIINGEIDSQKGSIIKPQNYRIGYLPQEEVVTGEGSVLENVLLGKPKILALEKKIKELHKALEFPGPEYNSLLDKLGSLEEQYQALGGYQVEASAKALLSGLGFSEDEFEKDYSELSGGWCMRAYLARLLLHEPDLLLLDEPTNHLDLPSMEWLEQYLLQFKGTIILVTHDRYFIDRLADEIYELDRGELSRYPGNYKIFLQQKEQKINLLRKKREEQLSERERLIRFINRYRSDKKRAAQVQSRIKMLEKLEIIDVPPQPECPEFSLSVPVQSFKDVLTIDKVSFRYDKDWILRKTSLSLNRGDKVALVGPNGAGKTTLTRLIAGDLSPREGIIRLGERTVLGYYAQHQILALNLNNTVFSEVASTVAQEHIPRIRDVLGIFQFSGDEVFKKIKVLSGGEKARVTLAKILLSLVNFLIMDEPTTHLDMTAREALEEALQKYEGTLILISHDRYFLDQIVNRVVELRNGQLEEYYGNYSYYLEKKEKEKEELKEQSESQEKEKLVEKAGPNSGRKTKEQKRKEAEARQAISQKRARLRREIGEFENEIKQLEERKRNLEAFLARPETYKEKGKEVAGLQKDYAYAGKRLEELYRRREKAEHQLEELLASLP